MVIISKLIGKRHSGNFIFKVVNVIKQIILPITKVNCDCIHYTIAVFYVHGYVKLKLEYNSHSLFHNFMDPIVSIISVIGQVMNIKKRVFFFHGNVRKY